MINKNMVRQKSFGDWKNMAQRNLHCNKVNLYFFWRRKVVEPKMRGRGGRSSGWSKVKHAMKEFAILIKPLIHGGGPVSGVRGEQGGAVGNGEKGIFPQGGHK